MRIIIESAKVTTKLLPTHTHAPLQHKKVFEKLLKKWEKLNSHLLWRVEIASSPARWRCDKVWCMFVLAETYSRDIWRFPREFHLANHIARSSQSFHYIWAEKNHSIKLSWALQLETFVLLSFALLKLLLLFFSSLHFSHQVQLSNGEIECIFRVPELRVDWVVVKFRFGVTSAARETQRREREREE